jgi:hypothetical protein
MRLTVAVSAIGGFFIAFNKSQCMSSPWHATDLSSRVSPQKLIRVIDRFYGVTENKREVEMDMKEMVGKAKRGEPLYGKSQLSEYMQGVAARNSRYSGTFLHILPFANFVNHNQVSSPIEGCITHIPVLRLTFTSLARC